MRFYCRGGIAGAFLYLLIASTIALQEDEEDELLDEVIPHKLSKRVYHSPTKRQFIEPGYGAKDGAQLMQMPQAGEQPFLGAPQQMPIGGEQLPGAAEQLPGQLPAVEQTADQTPGLVDQTVASQNNLEQGFGQNVIDQSPLAVASQPASSRQYSQGSTQVTDPTMNYNPSSVTELNVADSGYKITTDTREKAKSLASDVKDFGLWEYSVDNTAAATDQTAKILQNKLLEDDNAYNGKDSASLNINQLANAQGTKIDQLLDIFNKNGLQNQVNKADTLDADTKSLEDYDSAKGFTAIEGNGKHLTSSSFDDNNVNTQDSAQVMNSEPDVSVVTMPNTYKLEDEHGNPLDSVSTGAKPIHAAERPNIAQLLKALLRKKIQAEAAKLMLKKKATQTNKGLKQLVTSLEGGTNTIVSVHSTEAPQLAATTQSSVGDESTGKQGISKTELKLLHFIKNMLKGTSRNPMQGDLTDGEMTSFMGAMKEMADGNGKVESENKDQSESTEKVKSKPQETKNPAEGNTQVVELSAGASDDQTKAKSKEKQKQKMGDNEKEMKNSDKNEKSKGEEADVKVSAIKALLKQMKPTTRTNHDSFYLDPEEPLNSPSEKSNTLMNYLEHETALVNQFQEGSQIGDPTKQLKHIAQLLLDVAHNSKTKDAVLDARRTTVSPRQDTATDKPNAKSRAVGGKGGKSAGKEGIEDKVEGQESSKEIDSSENNKNKQDNKKEEGTAESKAALSKEKEDGKSEATTETEQLGQKNKGEIKNLSKEDNNMKSATNEMNKKEKGLKNDNQKEEEKTADKNVNNGEKETDEGKEDSREEKTKEDSKLPNVQKVRDNGKIVEVLGGKNKESHDKTAYENESKDKDDENVKSVNKISEMSKLRNNKKIVSKMDGNNDEDSPVSNENKITEKPRKEKEKSEKEKSDLNEDTADNGNDKNEDRPKSKANKNFDGEAASDSNEKINGGLKPLVKGDQKDNELTDNVRPSHHLSPEHDLHSKFISAENDNDEKGKSHLTPQLPFLNPGKAHLDVLENDISLKQYLLQKGKEKILHRLRGSQSYNENSDAQVAESFDNDSNGPGKSSRINDVTGSIKAKIAKKPERKVPTISHSRTFHRARPNLVSFAAKIQPLNIKSKGLNAIRPMPRFLMHKYKSMLTQMPGKRPLGLLRHIAPSDRNRNSDASIRFAAIAKLISIMRDRQRLIDVTASKKSLPDSKSPIRPQLNGLATAPRNNSVLVTTPMISSFFNSRAQSNAVIVPTGARRTALSILQPDSDGEATGIETSTLLTEVQSPINDASVDPSDVTRSQLEKPKQPSINQVMDLLGGSSKNNGTLDINTTTKGDVNSKSTAKYSESKQTNTQKTMNIDTTSMNKKIHSRGHLVMVAMSPGMDNKIGGALLRKPQVITPIHDQDAASAFVKQPDKSDLIRSLKSDITSTTFLLRKRNKIPKIKHRKHPFHHRQGISHH